MKLNNALLLLAAASPSPSAETPSGMPVDSPRQAATEPSAADLLERLQRQMHDMQDLLGLLASRLGAT
ncbi:hypothetical protein J9978_05075 [Chromobacterium violaceum]|uniref:hypothetical protein n=1 Tax=Chromobacterium violaceum TaxID=536 RepID=UPI0009D98A98|nr:hypothetical protein [Chromobacterium violaceum]MBP4048869.1 hypothetical protein [Chromobacterium violaceum]OQS30735.1 hypothetical protein B0T41_02030 [Chromobacterium violaceum]